MINDREFWENAFAAGVRDERERQGRSQEWLAEQMSARGFKFHQATVHKIESKDRRVSIGEAVTLSEVLGVALERLMKRQPDAAEVLERELNSHAHSFISAILALDDAAIDVSSLRLAFEVQVSQFDSRGNKLTSPITGEEATATATYSPLTSFGLADDFVNQIRSEAWTPEFKDLVRYYSGFVGLGTGHSKDRPRNG